MDNEDIVKNLEKESAYDVVNYQPPVYELPDTYYLPDGKGWEIEGKDYTEDIFNVVVSNEDEIQFLEEIGTPQNATESYLRFISYQIVEIKTFILWIFVCFVFFRFVSWFKAHL